MTLLKHAGALFVLIALNLVFLFGGAPAIVAGNGALPGFNTTTPYLIYYGSWNSTQVDFARRNYRLVILDAHSITAAQVATIKRGPDNIAGTVDDVRVFGYVSVAEDNRPGAPVAGDGLGPRIDPRSSDSVPLSSITNALGLPSPGGTGYASYYLDTKSAPNGIPDQNTTFGGYYVNAGAPAWWTTLKNMTIATDGNAGLDEILTTNVGKGLNCDGLFVDTIDTCAPNSFGATTYEWTTPGMQTIIQRMYTNYPTKLIMANRGLFFFNPNFKHYAYTLRSYIHLLMFESYYTDSNNSDQVNPYFADNKYDYAPKLNAEAGRPDGFTIVALGYDHTPALPPSVITQDYVESMGIQGWPLYRTNPSLNSSFNTNAMVWLSTNADIVAPVWDSTAAQSETPPAPRVGIQQATPGNQSITVFWDVARDQTQPVRYNIYYTSLPALDFSTASKLTHVAPSIPTNYLSRTGPGIYAYQYTVTGLSNGVSYLFAVRAEDSAIPSHEDTNIVTLSAVPGLVGAAGTFRNMTIDGDFSDWAGIPWLYQGAADSNVINFAKIQLANDANYLYGHFTLFSNAAPFSDYNTHLFIDRDGNQQTGYQVSGALFGSEFMVEGSAGYDQRNGNFNAGTVSNLGWARAPSGSTTEFEFRVSLAAAYADTRPVFTTNVFRLMLQDNRGSEVAIATGIPYVLALLPPSTYSHITLDGSFSDWTCVPIIATAPTNASGFSFQDCSVANDNVYLYVRFSLHSAAAPFSDINTHLFIDTDNNSATGYHTGSTSIGSELMVESGVANDERNGSFAAGTVSGVDWLLTPGGSSTNFELRISRLARYADNSLVFTNPTIRIVLADNRGSLMTAAGIPYRWAWGGPYEDWRAFYFTPAQLADPAVSDDGADASGDGIANLVKYAFDLNPLVMNHPDLPRGFIENAGGSNYLDVTYVQRDPPAGVQYIPEVSSDLASWDSSPTNFTQISDVPNGDGTSLVSLRLLPAIGASLSQRFVRIGISR